MLTAKWSRSTFESILDEIKEKYNEASNAAYDAFHDFVNLMEDKYPELKEERY